MTGPADRTAAVRPTSADQGSARAPSALDAADRKSLDSGLSNVARIYDALLGGKDNFAADREAARKLVEAVPGAARAARDNRAFLARVVHFLAAEAGISQFLDIGTGLPVRGHVQEVAQAVNPGARVVYADNDRCKSGCAHAEITVQSSRCRLRQG